MEDIMIRVSIIGATGYAGAELLRLLYNHPQVQVVHITSESYTGKKFLKYILTYEDYMTKN